MGNDWGTSATVDGEELSWGDTITFEKASTIKIKCVAEEYDKIPDVGSATLKIKLSDADEGDQEYTQEVTVRENRGRYSGNTATWVFKFGVTKDRRIK